MQQRSVEISSVKWVLKELQPMLKDVQRALEACAEQGASFADLQPSIELLGQVRGTLQMVELHGAAQLADEMQHASNALLAGQLSDSEAALETLLRAALQLPDYLERLQAGSRDVPLVLLPLLNELRTSRGAEPLTERELFFPDLNAAPEAAPSKPPAPLKLIARAQRRRFQRHLLEWFKNLGDAQPLLAIDKVLEVLEQASVAIASRRVFYIARAMVESAAAGGLSADVVKPYMGQIDRLLRTLITSGEPAFQQAISLDLLKGMLYLVASSSTDGRQVNQVRATYQLAKLLPTEEQVALAKETLAGPNLELLAVVNASIKEDLSQIKDAIEIYVHGEDNDTEQLRPIQELLGRVTDTVHMLGITEAQRLLNDQAPEVEEMLAAGGNVSTEQLMTLASRLLSVEEALDDYVNQRADLMGTPIVVVNPHEDLPIAALPGPEFQSLLGAVIREALGDLAKAREGILAFLANPDRIDHIQVVPGLLHEVNGAMFMLPLDRVVPLLNGLGSYIRLQIVGAGHYPPEREQHLLADVVAAIEYYLEAVEQGRGDMTHILERGSEALAELGAEPVTPAEPSADEAAATDLSPAATAARPPALAEDEQESEAEAESARERERESESARERVAATAERPAVHTLQILSEDVDEEILEVFLEEALTELQEISQHLPLWRADTSNEASLVRIRRSFHTLKGSGRVIGAELIGEFAWSVENLLNQVIAGRVNELDPVFQLLQESLGVLPQLIEQLRGNSAPIESVDELIARGHQLANPELEAAAEPPAAAPAVEETPQPALEPEETIVEELPLIEEPVQLAPVHDIGDDEAVPPDEVDSTLEDMPAPELEELTLEEPQPEAAAPVEEPLEEQQQAPTDDAAIADNVIDIGIASAATTDEPEVPAEVDSVDFDVNELVESLEVEPQADIEIEPAPTEPVDIEFIDVTVPDSAGDEPPVIEPPEPEVETPETAAAAPDQPDAADLPLEQVASPNEPEQVGVDPEITRRELVVEEEPEEVTMESYADVGEGVDPEVTRKELVIEEDPEEVTIESGEDSGEVLDAIEVEELAEVPAEPADETRLSEAGVDASDDAAAPAGEAAEGAGESQPEPQPEPVAATAEQVDHGIDPVLLEIFTREAEGHVRTLRGIVEASLEHGKQLHAGDEFIRALHTLHGSAQTAEVEDVAMLSGTLEKIAKTKQELGASFVDDETELVRECLAGLEQALQWFTQRGERPTNLRELEAQLRLFEKRVEGQTDDVEYDDELIGIFIEEGDELLENADRLLAQWRDRPRDQVIINDLQRQLHTLKGGARMANFTPIADLSHTLETLVLTVTENNQAPELAVFELLHEAVDALTVMLEQARQHQPVSRVDWLLDELNGLREGRPVEPRAEPQAAEADESAPAPAQAPEEEAPPAEAAPSAGQAAEQVRVSADLLDNLVNYAGEVNIYQSRLGQQVTDYRFNLEELDQTVFRLRDQLRKMELETEAQIIYRHEKEAGDSRTDFDPLELDRYSQIQELSRALMESVSDLESIKGILGDITRDSESLLQQQSRLSSDLQDGLMRTRMVRFDRLSARLARIVRQTGITVNKKAELEIRGGETEIDRSVQERVIAPLEHMLRNAISHGIELPGERRRLGKPSTGRITIDLQRDGTDVLITVEDDGAGVNLEAVRAKAVVRGLLARNAQITDEDLLQLILETGMSTAQEVTQISGRGVGMDVVASEIKQLGGTIDIETTANVGTRFVVRLPLTLAINQALLVEASGEAFALPLTGITGVAQVSGAELQKFYVDRTQKYNYGGEEYDVHHLGTMLDIGAPRLGDHEQVWPLVMLRAGDHRVALHVEGLLGRREVVVKPVGPQISTVRGVSGASILADGTVVLILDAASLLRSLTAGQAGQAEEVTPAAEPRTGVTVMVVDDSITIRKVTQRMLERHDINVIAAKDGVDAVTLLGDHLPDLMLLDIEMPRMDGYEVAAYVRNNERLHKVPIIMITSRTGDKHRRRAEEIGVDQYLGKPYQENELLEHINRLLADTV